jgi:hypothetical protein
VGRSWRYCSTDVQAQALAADLLNEIMAAAYTDPENPSDALGTDSGESGGDRTTWDDIDDYDGWTESPPENKNGSPLPNSTGWTRSVNVQKLSWSNPTLTVNDNFPEQGVRLITVSVTGPNGKSATLKAIRSHNGVTEQALGVDLQVVSGLTVDLEAGGAPESQQGTNTLNHSRGP